MAIDMRRKQKASKMKGGGGKSKFVYKPRTADDVKERAERSIGRFDSIFKSNYDIFRAKQGDNTIRFLPPSWDDHRHYAYSIFLHRKVGPDNGMYLCLQKMKNEPCPVCALVKELRDSGEADDARQMQWQENCVAWVLDREGDDPTRPLLYQMSVTRDRDITALAYSKKNRSALIIDHPDEGYDFSFKKARSDPNQHPLLWRGH